MTCNNCGARIPENNEICPKCGSLVQRRPGGYDPSLRQSTLSSLNRPVSPSAPSPGSAAGTPTTRVVRYGAPPSKKKHKGLKAVLITFVCLIVAAGGVYAYVQISNSNAARYKDAIAMISSNPSAAKEELSSLDGYGDSSEQAAACQNALDYKAAKDMMDKGDFAGAKAVFEALGNYEDSVSLADECQYGLDYASAKALYDAERYGEAKTAFSALGSYNGADDMTKSCDYAIAQAFYKEKNFYSAYVIFDNLGDYKDAADKSKSCIQSKQKTGQLYRNPKYKSKSIAVTIKTPKDGYCTCVRFYKGDTLVSSLFIANGKSVKVKLPVGTYSLKSSYGKVWFGDKETFGPDGSYLNYGNVKLKKNYYYTYTLRIKKGNSKGSTIDYGGF